MFAGPLMSLQAQFSLSKLNLVWIQVSFKTFLISTRERVMEGPVKQGDSRVTANGEKSGGLRR